MTLFKCSLHFDLYFCCRDALLGALSEMEAEVLAAGVPMNTGSTASVALMNGPQLLVANIGDSRTILCRGTTAIEMTMDQKPSRPDEVARISHAKGWVINDRVIGRLGVARAIGDALYKANPIPFVSARPELTQVHLCTHDRFLLLACDGLFDVMTSQAAVDFARQRLNAGMALHEVCRSLAQHAINCGSMDNVSVLIVLLDHSCNGATGANNSSGTPTSSAGAVARPASANKGTASNSSPYAQPVSTRNNSTSTASGRPASGRRPGSGHGTSPSSPYSMEHNNGSPAVPGPGMRGGGVANTGGGGARYRQHAPSGLTSLGGLGRPPSNSARNASSGSGGVHGGTNASSRSRASGMGGHGGAASPYTPGTGRPSSGRRSDPGRMRSGLDPSPRGGAGSATSIQSGGTDVELAAIGSGAGLASSSSNPRSAYRRGGTGSAGGGAYGRAGARTGGTYTTSGVGDGLTGSTTGSGVPPRTGRRGSGVPAGSGTGTGSGSGSGGSTVTQSVGSGLSAIVSGALGSGGAQSPMADIEDEFASLAVSPSRARARHTTSIGVTARSTPPSKQQPNSGAGSGASYRSSSTAGGLGSLAVGLGSSMAASSQQHGSGSGTASGIGVITSGLGGDSSSLYGSSANGNHSTTSGGAGGHKFSPQTAADRELQAAAVKTYNMRTSPRHQNSMGGSPWGSPERGETSRPNTGSNLCHALSPGDAADSMRRGGFGEHHEGGSTGSSVSGTRDSGGGTGVYGTCIWCIVPPLCSMMSMVAFGGGDQCGPTQIRHVIQQVCQQACMVLSTTTASIPRTQPIELILMTLDMRCVVFFSSCRTSRRPTAARQAR